MEKLSTLINDLQELLERNGDGLVTLDIAEEETLISFYVTNSRGEEDGLHYEASLTPYPEEDD